jgi:hypothetical protein
VLELGRGFFGEDVVKPFTIIAALLLLLIAACHAYRAYAGLDFIMAGHSIPIVASWVVAGVLALLGIMLLVERRK